MSTRPRYGEIAAFFDQLADSEDRWLARTGGYHSLLARIHASLIPPGSRVLEIGCGRGDLLAALRPSRGLGIDISRRMIEVARERHPELEFDACPGEELERDERFDYIVMSDLVPYVDDLQALFTAVAAHSHPATRVVISSYSNAWRPLLALLAWAGLRPRRPIRNWVAPADVGGLADLAGLEVVTERKEIVAPVGGGLVSRLLNGLLVRLPLLRQLALTYWLIGRPSKADGKEMSVSVIVPCRNEAGSAPQAAERVPDMGRQTEIIFVEGGSTDDTRERVEEEIQRSERDMRLVVQSGHGKWNAVQEGFAAAHNDMLVILDGDLTVAPEDLPKFYEALASGRGDLINGSRLVYGMESGAMRFLNIVGNKLFAALLSFVLCQYVKDTLCGTKALRRADWERIRDRREELGRVDDPFGDFDLLLGASLLGMKIVNVPVRYSARSYGRTNIRRFRNGAALARLTLTGFRRIWVTPVAGCQGSVVGRDGH